MTTDTDMLRELLDQGLCLCSSASTDWNGVRALLDERDRMLATIARVEALADEWDEEAADLIRNCYSGQDVFEGEQMQRCATALRAALAGEGA